MKLMKQEKQQEIALMRYGAIAPIIPDHEGSVDGRP